MTHEGVFTEAPAGELMLRPPLMDSQRLVVVCGCVGEEGLVASLLESWWTRARP